MKYNLIDFGTNKKFPIKHFAPNYALFINYTKLSFVDDIAYRRSNEALKSLSEHSRISAAKAGEKQRKHSRIDFITFRHFSGCDFGVMGLTSRMAEEASTTKQDTYVSWIFHGFMSL